MFTYAATISMWLLFAVWVRSSPINTFIKIALLGMALWGSYESLGLK